LSKNNFILFVNAFFKITSLSKLLRILLFDYIKNINYSMILTIKIIVTTNLE